MIKSTARKLGNSFGSRGPVDPYEKPVIPKPGSAVDGVPVTVNSDILQNSSEISRVEKASKQVVQSSSLRAHFSILPLILFGLYDISKHGDEYRHTLNMRDD